MVSRTHISIGLLALCGLAPAGTALGDVIPLEIQHRVLLIGKVFTYSDPNDRDSFYYEEISTELGAWSYSNTDTAARWELFAESSIDYHGDISPTHVNVSTTATSHVSGNYHTGPSQSAESEVWAYTTYRFQITEPMYVSIEAEGVYQDPDRWGSGIGVWLASVADGVLLDEYRGVGALPGGTSDIGFGQMLPAGEYIWSSYTVSFLAGVDVQPTNSTTVIASNIRMSLIPVPGSAVLLGLGAVVCPARRRR